ncbi:MAG TPA: hypothetical protein P5114_06040, partial [Hyphomicrobiaceae bacterium]|nr:hypothetical protein [Hyphomicrobiaceae bacterium]
MAHDDSCEPHVRSPDNATAARERDRTGSCAPADQSGPQSLQGPAVSAAPATPEPELAIFHRGNVPRLAIAQALAGANSVVVYATGAIVGNMFAPNKALATLPISLFVVGMAACTLPAGAIARRYGRRVTFLIGTACGVAVGLLGAIAVLQGSFWLFCIATFFGGAYNA